MMASSTYANISLYFTPPSHFDEGYYLVFELLNIWLISLPDSIFNIIKEYGNLRGAPYYCCFVMKKEPLTR